MNNEFGVRFLFIGIAIGGMLSSPNVIAEQALPQSPEHPTLNDCQALADAYYGIKDQATERLLQCFHGPAHIGPGEEVGWPACHTRHAMYRAWPQCFPAELETCEISQHQDSEYQLCYKRAQVTDAAQVNAKRMNDAYAKYKDFRGTFDHAVGVVSDPKQTIFDVLSENGAKEIASTMFSTNGRLRDEHIADANEIYKLLFNVTGAVSAATSSGVIRDLQATAFRELKHNFDFTMARLYEAAQGMESIKIDELTRGVAHDLPMVSKPDLQGGLDQGNAADNCDILRQPDASRDLQNQNEDAWLTLVGKCTQ